jgi:shikimate dehydrogenase
MTTKKQFGLVGKNIDYSFSKKYFTEKFEKENLINHSYQNFDIHSVFEITQIVKNPNLCGLNVTIPYKEEIIPFLDKISKKAKKIGAVNTIKITKKGKLKGYNTDFFGFQKSLSSLLNEHHKKALILGTGGASKAVAFALKKLGIQYSFVSQKLRRDYLSYEKLNEAIFQEYQIIINCTPLGTFPDINSCPNIPYNLLNSNHIVFDLVYNPEETIFLQKAKQNGATTKNGMEMLVFQAEKAWEIWNKK